MNKKKTNYRIIIVALTGLIVSGCVPAYGKTIRALFLGNSYTYTNDLPGTVAGLALSGGDTLVYDSSTPGGYTLQQHCTNSTTLSLIAEGNWDYVILQEQSQLPSFPDEQVAEEVYPYAKKLDSLIKAHNDCAKTVFYVTWGRKNGDAMNCAVFPPVCTYEGMDSLLQLRYSIMADSNNALLSPVANVWRSIRADHPGIELYDADESHPSAKGTFAAACTFYSVLFGKDPVACTFSGTIGATDADIIKHTAKAIVYDSLDHWSAFYPAVTAGFDFTISGGSVLFNNLSENADMYTWFFGDGNTSAEPNPEYTYSSNGSYEVMLVAHDCADSDTLTRVVNITAVGIEETEAAEPIRLYPNPVSDNIYIESSENTGQVIISDITGRIMSKHTITGKTPQPVNIERLSPGAYLIKISTRTKTYTSRFIKK